MQVFDRSDRVGAPAFIVNCIDGLMLVNDYDDVSVHTRVHICRYACPNNFLDILQACSLDACLNTPQRSSPNAEVLVVPLQHVQTNA